MQILVPLHPVRSRPSLISPTRSNAVTVVHHPNRKFWVLEHSPTDVWPLFSGLSLSDSLFTFVPARIPLLYRRRHAIGLELLIDRSFGISSALTTSPDAAPSARELK